MLDLGANVECDAENLVQFAVMGNVFARIVLGLPQPIVGLLNVGSEDMKGNDAVRGAHRRLARGASRRSASTALSRATTSRREPSTCS